ncbi:serine/threonine protein kinase [Saprolegnia diclina VS20]|uniref:Serine/threonine protein kinase n=1 Tax=Saprolegnia diclina (strain VS20) TaxID=1156394 RepID=T0SIB2_SAPDV|nr:serine/threonine protein kinase [Saprolegnia diclina VS20]EQC42607.1 serine/threonine protein kinase [Saprolegnia diclina VS20]|eukprot:XP_008604030.1 serine/threonine protein kinase [Saprolegnia diclina VS20]
MTDIVLSPRHISLSRVVVEKTEGRLLARSTYWEIYEATYGATTVAALCYRQSSRRDTLWAATVHYIDRLLAAVHPNVLQVIGLVYDLSAHRRDALPEWLLVEKTSMSLFDALHTHKIVFSDADVITIAIQVVQAIAFCNGVGLRHLTSRKVLMLDISVPKIKIGGLFQRDILEMANAPTGATPYEPPATASAINADMYAFGVLLWELCTSEKPTVELFHCTAQVRVARPHLELAESLIRACTHEDAGSRPSATEVLAELVDFQARRASQPPEMCCPPPPSNVVLHQTLQRLAAVESQVLDEQRNFDVVVGQLEFANAEIASLQALLSVKADGLGALETAHARARARVADLEAIEAPLETQLAAATQRVRELEHETQRLEHQTAHQREQAAKTRLDVESVIFEKQQLRQLVQTLEVNLRDAETTLAQEKDVSDELNVRWQQTIKHCQHEQLQREKVERQLTQLRLDNKEAVDQLRDWHPDTGVLAKQRQATMDDQVLDHLHRIQALSREMVALKVDMTALQDELVASRAREHALDIRVVDLQCALTLAEAATATANAASTDWADRFAQQADDLQASLDAYKDLQRAHADVQHQLSRELQQRHDEEMARKARRCLDLNCDAPPFLIQSSGYCKDHHEKRERAKAEKLRQLEEVQRQKPPDDVAADAFALGGVQQLVSVVETFQKSAAIVAAVLKKLHVLCEAHVTHKNELGDFGGFPALVRVAQHQSTLEVTQLALARLFGVAAFNHDVNRIRLVSEGALDSLLLAMTGFTHSVSLQKSSCTTLTNLAHNCEGNRRKILEKGGLERILDAMQAFPKEPSLQESACWALISLAGSDYMCEHIAARGGVGAILAAMLNCPSVASVQYYGVWALLNVVSGVETLQEFATQEGAIEVCEAAIACFPEHAGIQDKAQCVLDMLTDNQELCATDAVLPDK